MRANPPRLRISTQQPSPLLTSVEEGDKEDRPRKRARALQEETSLEVHSLGSITVPRLAPSSGVPKQMLRISAGRAAAVAGIHPFMSICELGDLFLEHVYQDMPDLLVRDAEIVGVKIVSPEAERARLMEKSGAMEALESTLGIAAMASWVETSRESRKAVAHSVAAAAEAGKLTLDEASDLQRKLELEINLGFGTRHEDEAIKAYEAKIGRSVYGQQRRVSLMFPRAGPAEALARIVSLVKQDPMPSDSEHCTDTIGDTLKEGDAAVSADMLFRLTGFVDGLVDFPHADIRSAESQTTETLVVEVKHRMASIKDPPDIYDVVQLCSYCRAFGLTRGQLVQCLRKATDFDSAGQPHVHVTSFDFSEGSQDRRGWDQHVLPALYEWAGAVYRARDDESTRLQLLASSPTDRAMLVCNQLCPHLAR